VGEQGVAQLVDLLITTEGPLPGAKLIEWNMADPVGAPGSAGMWEVHFRVGGAVGTKIDPTNCPRGDGSSAPASACAGAWALMHITTKATAYLENIWGWVADHDLDYDDQINVYNARGLLVESQGPVWMYGTAFEHSLLYQYNLHGANNIYMGMIQTETPYFQPSANTPFSNAASSVLAVHETDPTFCSGDARCNMAYGLVIQNGSEGVLVYGTGLYSFFSTWDQECLTADTGYFPNCQLELTKVSSDSKVSHYTYDTCKGSHANSICRYICLTLTPTDLCTC
jgi:glucan 1,3-beta-glucosidase